MCGIHVTISRHGFVSPDQRTLDLLRHRGPDSLESLQIVVDHGQTIASSGRRPQAFITLTSSVLSLRGDHIVRQPAVSGGADPSRQHDQVLCWNGEAWSIAGCPINGNDSELVFRALTHIYSSHAVRLPHSDNAKYIADLMSSLAGPYAFVFLDQQSHRIYFARDFLGRRSLLRHSADNGDIHLCSVSTPSVGPWHEVDTDGINWVDLGNSNTKQTGFDCHVSQADYAPFPLQLCAYDSLSIEQVAVQPDSPCVAELERHLRDALRPRLQYAPSADGLAASVAVLFSGGLDCTVLARLAHDILPSGQTIDLLNVAFENPRVHKTRAPHESPYELCPDRQTGRQSYAELQQQCPARPWRFVAINVPYADTCAYRDTVLSLIHPHNTEMDLSIGCALYFAARGAGVVEAADGSPHDYRSPARILISGLGADELFGGYSRHEIAFNRRGYQGLHEELELDVGRLGKRNLGRDDRVISHWAREARFPFLDETLVRWALAAPVWQKCGFGQSVVNPHPGLEPGKLVLRCLAWRLGMQQVAKEKKRAVSVTHTLLLKFPLMHGSDPVRRPYRKDGSRAHKGHEYYRSRSTRLMLVT